MITREEEQASLNRDTIEYTPSVQRGRSKLLRNILTRSPVRVLRDSKLKSINAPKAGLRYDGLCVCSIQILLIMSNI